MEYLLGFLIAAAVGLTGVGAGTITAPVLILFFHLPAADSVGTALTFAAVIKLAVLPVYLRRKQVGFRILLLLCAGGIPGVLVGVYVIGLLNAKKHEGALFAVLGATILIMALFNLYRALQDSSRHTARDRSRWLPPIAALIGAEVGFSSAGAGALGSLALLNLTTLTPAQVVGTDMVFGLVVSVIGGGFHFFAGHYNAAMLTRLLIGGVAGALVGANLSAVIPSRPLRMALSVWLAVVGAQLCWKAVG
jgi:uncharacterized membrane protein YfcA